MTNEANAFFVIACAFIGYLLGNFQTAVVISKRFFREDVRKYGSGNAGTSNMIRVFGIVPGLCTFAGDFLKGILAVAIGRMLMGKDGGMIAGAFVVIGHCWPVLMRFKGGKGVATSLAVVLMVYPLAALVGLIVGLTVFAVWRIFSLMSLSGTVAILIATLFFKLYDLPLVILVVFLAAVIFFRHRENIGRLIRGEEKKFRR